MLSFGVDYYPEQWPEERWEPDADLMARAGFNVVRLAEFAWARMEPAEGTLDFAWLERAISLLHSRGLSVVLGTPTASPPSWLMQGNQALFKVGEDGRAVTYGNRREYCPSNRSYRAHCGRIVAAMADRFGRHPAVVGWQIDNEFGDRCFCESCRAAFQAWLRARHGTLDELNRHWGTAFWSHTYGAWEHVPPPLSSGGAPNPGLALDFRRFVSDLYVELQREQIGLIRERSPGRFVTHNLMGFGYDGLDYFALAQDLDFVSWDNYPRTQWHMASHVDPASAALSHAAMRGLKGERGFWVMEQQAGPAGWELVGVPPRPGELALWAWQSVAHGAEGIVFFRWRTARFGTEQHWHGLLDHDGSATRRYREIAGMGPALAKIGPRIAGSRFHAETAMLISPDSRFSLRIQPANPGLDYGRLFSDIHACLHGMNVGVDVVGPDADFARYRLLIAPLLTVLRPGDAARLDAFVRRGGLLVLTCRSGVRDEHNALVGARFPGELRELCGLEVDEYDSLPAGSSRTIRFLLPALRKASGAHPAPWCEVLELAGAEAVALYGDGHYRGRPAVAINRHGDGRAVYVGIAGGQKLWQRLCPWLCAAAGVSPLLDAPEGVEVTELRDGSRRVLFLLNHGDRPRRVRLGRGSFTDLLGDARPVSGRAALQPRGVRILATGTGSRSG